MSDIICRVVDSKMVITKAQIKREIRARGGVMKRTADEVVAMIKRNAEVLGQESIGSNTWLFWSLGFEYNDARQVSSKLIEEVKH